jgi:hypothetical protein
VCNHTYSPETEAKQTAVMFAGAVDSYALQVGPGPSRQERRHSRDTDVA